MEAARRSHPADGVKPADQLPFSFVLEAWLRGHQPKTLGALIELFAEKSFAVVMLALMSVPALPLPTGGVTHLFEIVAMLVALELVVGRRRLWLPRRWRGLSVERLSRGTAADRVVAGVKWAERIARPRWAGWLQQRQSLSLVGLMMFGLTLVAFLAPPFSGLDTLPALGVVILALGLIFDDAVMLLIGVIVGAVGTGLVVALGRLVYQLI